MIKADDELVTAVSGGSATDYDKAGRMPARDLLNLCVAYLRRVASEIKASKRHGK
jgi:hypothetical protein